jgi:PKD repeat protein
VSFKDLSWGKPTSWAWDFENDGVVDSTDQNLVHTYPGPGKYSISLTVTNAAGSDAEVRKDYITVNPERPPDAKFTASPRAGTAPLTVTFRDLSKGTVDSWLWNFGDGSISTEQSPVHLYATPGTYSVNLTVANEGGSDIAIMKNFIKVNEKKPGTPGPGTSGENNGGEGAKPGDQGRNEKPKIKLS